MMGDRPVETRPEIQVLPTSSLNDEDLHITARGLDPKQRVVIRAHVFTESGRYRFESKAYYRADASGVVKVGSAPSLGGSYTGVEPMGLVWGLEPTPEVVHEGPRLVKKQIDKPFVYTFELVDEHGSVLHSAKIERWYLASYVERRLFTHGRAEGGLYLPKQKGTSDPLPVIIDIRGGVPFLVEDRPALLASHGFAVLSINYYMKLIKGKMAFHGEPNYFALSTFVDIYDFIVAHPRLDASRVGVVSSCLGSTLALQAAARLGELFPIKCISATGCLDFLGYDIGLKLTDGTLIDPYDTSQHYEVTEEEGDTSWKLSDFSAFDDLEGDFIVPVADISCPMLFFTVGDDQHIPSHKRMLVMTERIEQAGKSNLLEVIHLEGAGHFIDAPYLPLCRKATLSSTLPYTVLAVYGGNPRLHAKGLKTAWRKTINWFRCQLGVTEIYRDDWLVGAEKNSRTPISRL